MRLEVLWVLEMTRDEATLFRCVGDGDGDGPMDGDRGVNFATVRETEGLWDCGTVGDQLWLKVQTAREARVVAPLETAKFLQHF